MISRCYLVRETISGSLQRSPYVRLGLEVHNDEILIAACYAQSFDKN
jgi:hypothetical protein